jgi:general secretion pathway protein D
VSPAQAYGDQLNQAQGSVSAVRTGNATVTADINTNSIIVIAPPAVQQMYAELIKKLDERRPQVQVECTIVTMDTHNDYSYGIDVGTQGGAGKGTIISFGSFGVSKVDPATGGLTPVAAPGGTFALLNPTTADVVLRALSSSSRARLVSSPQVLVNDNGKGTLESVNEAPFSEVVTNATVAQQGLGGLAKAGTTIHVEPHISEDDYLQLSYSIVLSSFTGSSSNGLPPPSQSNTVESTVTIPDGYTIVVGGLKVRNSDASVQSIPILDQIPILKDIIGSHSKTNANTTLFVFIRPTILRDDQFRDLKYISDRATGKAGIKSNYPESAPIPIR